MIEWMNEVIEIWMSTWNFLNMNGNFPMWMKKYECKFWIWNVEIWNSEYEFEWWNMYGISLNYEWMGKWIWMMTNNVFALDTLFLWREVQTSNRTNEKWMVKHTINWNQRWIMFCEGDIAWIKVGYKDTNREAHLIPSNEKRFQILLNYGN